MSEAKDTPIDKKSLKLDEVIAKTKKLSPPANSTDDQTPFVDGQRGTDPGQGGFARRGSSRGSQSRCPCEHSSDTVEFGYPRRDIECDFREHKGPSGQIE